MKKTVLLAMVLMLVAAAAPAMAAYGEDPCVVCHQDATPDIVKQYEEGRHNAMGVKCLVCHKASKDDASIMEHNGFRITAQPPAKHCEGCHATEVSRYSGSKSEWASFSGKAHATK